MQTKSGIFKGLVFFEVLPAEAGVRPPVAFGKLQAFQKANVNDSWNCLSIIWIFKSVLENGRQPPSEGSSVGPLWPLRPWQESKAADPPVTERNALRKTI
jgi:hypothetical protein